MDLRETSSGDQKRPSPRPVPTVNLGRRIFSMLFYMGTFSGLGYFLWKFAGNAGTDKHRERKELEKRQGKRDQTPNKEQMMIDTLMGKGPASLAELREQTTQKRYKIAEENTVYAIPQEDKSKDTNTNSAGDKTSDKKDTK